MQGTSVLFGQILAVFGIVIRLSFVFIIGGAVSLRHES